MLDDSTRVAGTVVHQLCHVALGTRNHGAKFKALATAVGLVGKMTATVEGPLFLQVMQGIIDRIGPYRCGAAPDPRPRKDDRRAADTSNLPRMRVPDARHTEMAHHRHSDMPEPTMRLVRRSDGGGVIGSDGGEAVYTGTSKRLIIIV